MISSLQKQLLVQNFGISESAMLWVTQSLPSDHFWFRRSISIGLLQFVDVPAIIYHLEIRLR
jgi:hypothetical protein